MKGQFSPSQASGVRNSDDLSGRGMNHPGVRPTGAVKLPDALVVISGSGGDSHDAIKGAEFDSAGLISFQREAPGVLKIGPLDYDIEMLVCNGFSAAPEKLNDVFCIHSAQEKIFDPIAAKLSIDYEGLVGGELDFLLALASHFGCGN